MIYKKTFLLNIFSLLLLIFIINLIKYINDIIDNSKTIIEVVIQNGDNPKGTEQNIIIAHVHKIGIRI